MSKGKLSVILAVAALLLLPAGVAVAQETEAEASVGVVSDYTDNAGVLHVNGAITVTLNAVAPPAAGSVYEGWLVSNNGSVKLSLGIVGLDAAGNGAVTYQSPDQDLVALYDKLLITSEPADDTDPAPSDDVAFSAHIPSASSTYIRELLSSWPKGSDTGVFSDLRASLGDALASAELASRAGTLEAMKTHTQDFLDSIGDSAGFGDLQRAALAAAASPEVSTIVRNAGLVNSYGSSAEARVAEAAALGMEILDANNMLLAQVSAANAVGLLDAALNGFSATDPGVEQAYEAAQAMATYTLMPGTEGLPSALGPSLELLNVGDAAVPAAGTLAAALALIAAGALLISARRKSRTSA